MALAAGAADPSTATVHNTGLQHFTEIFIDHYIVLDSGWVVFTVEEANQGADLNGDGDMTDKIVHAYDPASGTTRNTALPGIPIAGNFGLG